MLRLWQAWVRRCAREEDLRPQLLVRVLVPLTVILDQLNVARLGLIPWLYVPWDAGGLSDTQDSFYVLGEIFPPGEAGFVAWGVMMTCMVLALFGVGTRPAIFIGVLAYAQLGHLHPGGDRAIDRILRIVLLMIMFSDAHKGWPWGRPGMGKAWPADFLRYLLVIIYLAAGIGKLAQQPRWLSIDGMPVLYRVMTDPMAAHMDAVWMQNFYLPLHLMGIATIVLELSSPLILTRFAPYWAIVGAGMHIGIFFTMDLGMFSWGMLAIYPLLFAPWINRWWGGRVEAAGAR